MAEEGRVESDASSAAIVADDCWPRPLLFVALAEDPPPPPLPRGRVREPGVDTRESCCDERTDSAGLPGPASELICCPNGGELDGGGVRV